MLDVVWERYCDGFVYVLMRPYARDVIGMVLRVFASLLWHSFGCSCCSIAPTMRFEGSVVTLRNVMVHDRFIEYGRRCTGG